MATHLTASGPCLVFALAHESAHARRHAARATILEVGVGPEAVERGLARALDARGKGPPFVLGAGFSGALDPALRTGDLILADEVVDEKGRSWETTWPGGHPTLRRGRILSTPRLLAGASEKREMGARTGALAVDMESAALAGVCHARGVPFGCLRVILDEQPASLSPVLGRLLEGARVSWWRLLGALLRRPSLLGELWRLGRGSRQAGGRLGEGLGALLGCEERHAASGQVTT